MIDFIKRFLNISNTKIHSLKGNWERVPSVREVELVRDSQYKGKGNWEGDGGKGEGKSLVLCANR